MFLSLSWREMTKYFGVVSSRWMDGCFRLIVLKTVLNKIILVGIKNSNFRARNCLKLRVEFNNFGGKY
jgi:hypothetical protein